ncbi:D-isomer specific 2-hydroxyacid dehydrogenase [Sparassis latifolia]
MARPRVLICGTLGWTQQECADLFEDVAEVIQYDSRNRTDFVSSFQPGGRYEDVVALYKDGGSYFLGPFDRELIGAISRSVKYIANIGAGYDQIDTDACRDNGILLTNTPGVVDEGTATAALYLMISVVRQFAKAEQDIRAGRWNFEHSAGSAHDLTGRTLAILGMGGIGMRLAELARAFPMRIVYHNRRKVEDAPEWCEYFGIDRLDEMLAITDVLSVHVPLKDDTVGFVNEAMIRRLKKGAVIVNTARGKVIDEEAMIRALEDGHLAGVGLDVFTNEPDVDTRLLELPNAALLPHMGCLTRETLEKMEIRALTNLRDMVVTGSAKDVVPELR